MFRNKWQALAQSVFGGGHSKNEKALSHSWKEGYDQLDN